MAENEDKAAASAATEKTEGPLARPQQAASPPSAQPPSSPPPPGRGGGPIAVIALVVALAAVGASGYLWFRVEVQQRLEQGLAVANLSGEVKGMHQAVAAVEKQQAQLANRQDNLDQQQNDLANSVATNVRDKISAVEDRQSALEKQQQELTGSVEKVYADLDRSLDSWALEEIEQLLRIANHSVRLSGDVKMGLAALELADRRLQKLGDPRLTDARALVADEITRLKAVHHVDLTGIAVRLSAMSDAVDQLPLAQQPERPIGDKPAGPGAAEQQSSWQGAATELWADLRNLVRIQNVTEPAKPLLAPEQRYFLVNNLRLMLSGAQLAVLRTDGATYTTDLTHAKAWLDDYFDTNDTAVASMIKDIDELSAIELRPALPDISASLVAISELKKQAEPR